MADDEGAAHATLLAEYRALEEEFEGQHELPEEIDTRLGELEVAMEKLETRPLIFDPEEIVRAGAFVKLAVAVELDVYRGYVRPEEEPREDAGVYNGERSAEDGQGSDTGQSGSGSSDGIGQGTVITTGGQLLGTDLPDGEVDGALKPLPWRLVTELTAHRPWLCVRPSGGLRTSR